MARQGKAMDPAAGSAKLDPIFNSTNFALSALTKPNFLSDAGITIGAHSGFIKASATARIQLHAQTSCAHLH